MATITDNQSPTYDQAEQADQPAPFRAWSVGFTVPTSDRPSVVRWVDAYWTDVPEAEVAASFARTYPHADVRHVIHSACG